MKFQKTMACAAICAGLLFNQTAFSNTLKEQWQTAKAEFVKDFYIGYDEAITTVTAEISDNGARLEKLEEWGINEGRHHTNYLDLDASTQQFGEKLKKWEDLYDAVVEKTGDYQDYDFNDLLSNETLGKEVYKGLYSLDSYKFYIKIKDYNQETKNKNQMLKHIQKKFKQSEIKDANMIGKLEKKWLKCEKGEGSEYTEASLKKLFKETKSSLATALRNNWKENKEKPSSLINLKSFSKLKKDIKSAYDDARKPYFYYNRLIKNALKAVKEDKVRQSVEDLQTALDNIDTYIVAHKMGDAK